MEWIKTEAGRRAFGEHLGLVMLVAAAKAEANEDQWKRLSQILPPLVRAHRSSDQRDTIRRVIRKVMGPEWMPAPEWRGFWSDDSSIP